MATNILTKDITIEEALILDSTNNDFLLYGKTEVPCPRCGGVIISKDYNTSYTIECEQCQLRSVYRGI